MTVRRPTVRGALPHKLPVKSEEDRLREELARKAREAAKLETGQ